MLLEFCSWLVDVVEDLLVIVSQWECKAAKIRLDNLGKLAKQIKHKQIALEKEANKVDVEMQLLNEFLMGDDNNVILRHRD